MYLIYFNNYLLISIIPFSLSTCFKNTPLYHDILALKAPKLDQWLKPEMSP